MVAATVARVRDARVRLWTVVGTHGLIDVYAAIVPAALIVLEARCGLTAVQTAWILGIGSLTSGLCQPLAAWWSDRHDSRTPAALGLAAAAAGMCIVGYAREFWVLALMYTIGGIGSGFYHPVAAASAGHLAGQIRGPGIGGRAMGVSVFHLAGMVGGIVGSLGASLLAARADGMEWMALAMVPGLIGAVLLQGAIRRMPHRHASVRDAQVSEGESAVRWRMVGLLYVANAMRFTVNMALVYLMMRWAQDLVAMAHPLYTAREVANASAGTVGALNALVSLGMAVGGISASAMIRAGEEKWAMVLLPIALAPVIAVFPMAGTTGALVLAVLSGIGFASLIPLTISVAQRLLPHRTGLASGLMMGGAWSLAFAGPRLAEWCMSGLKLSLHQTFMMTAGLLACSGLVCLGLRRSVLRSSHAQAQRHHAERHAHAAAAEGAVSCTARK